MEYINNDLNALINDFGINATINNSSKTIVKVVFLNNYNVSNNYGSFLGVSGNKPIIYMREKDYINNNLTVDDQLIINNKIYLFEEIKDNDYMYEIILKAE